MTRMPTFSSPFFLGFDDLERLVERAAKVPGDGFPPYNIERFPGADGTPERIVITLAVAGYASDDLDITVEDNQLIVLGKQNEPQNADFLHRGIAARQIKRSFVLAEGMQVNGAKLENGLLVIDLEKPEPERIVRRIDIATR